MAIKDMTKLFQEAGIVDDPVNHPEHYCQGKVECIDAITAAVGDLKGAEAFLTGNVIKYLWRWRHKNGVEDLRKARWYLDRLIKEAEHGKGHEPKDTL